MADKKDQIIRDLKRKTRRSWIQLRRGCEELKGEAVEHTTFWVGAGSRYFARRVAEETGMSYQQIINWLEKKTLGLE